MRGFNVTVCKHHKAELSVLSLEVSKHFVTQQAHVCACKEVAPIPGCGWVSRSPDTRSGSEDWAFQSSSCF